VFGIEPEVKKCIVVRARDHDDIAATTAIAARRSALGDELLAPERKDPVAAVAGFH
jgi:hypothetical protein